MELNETAEAGAACEAKEEACADIDIDGLIGVYDPRISQVQLIYRAVLRGGCFAAGDETEELICLIGRKSLKDLAFPSVKWSLCHWHEIAEAKVWPPFSNPPGQDGNYL